MYLLGYYLVTRMLFSYYCYWCYTSCRGIVPRKDAAWTNSWGLLLPGGAELITVLILFLWAAEKNPILRLYQWLEARGKK